MKRTRSKSKGIAEDKKALTNRLYQEGPNGINSQAMRKIKLSQKMIKKFGAGPAKVRMKLDVTMSKAKVSIEGVELTKLIEMQSQIRRKLGLFHCNFAL